MRVDQPVFCPRCGYPNLLWHGVCARCGQRLLAPGVLPPAIPESPPPQQPAAVPFLRPPWAPPRPASFSRILSEFFASFGKDVLRYLGVYLILGLGIQGVLALVGLAMPAPTVPAAAPATPAEISALLGSLMQSLVSTAAVTFLVTVALTSLVAGGVTDFAIRRRAGESVRFAESLRRGIRRYPTILLAALIYGAATEGIVLLSLGLMFAGFAGLPNPAAIALLCGGSLLEILGSVLAIFFSVVLVLYAPPIMMEKSTALGGLRRSWNLTRGHRWSLLGAILVVDLIAIAISLATGDAALSLRNPVVAPLAGVLATGLTGSWIVVVASVAYDLILRESGFAPSWPSTTPGVPPTRS
jgi:hypothetical protein